jgi:radical SAM superfamily enzyme YgiQ (UPF0313 family)
MNIVLINPSPEKKIQPHDDGLMPNISLGYIAAYAESKGFSCSIIDTKMESLSLKGMLERLASKKPDLIGFTAMTYEILRVNEMAKAIKDIYPSCAVVVGGVHTNAMPHETLVEFPSFDFVVHGEGEFTFYELILALSGSYKLKDVKGLLYRNNGHVKVSPQRERIKDLDSLPFPAWHLFPKAMMHAILSARGCPFECAFCAHNLSRKVVNRSPENTVEEIEHTIEHYNPKYIVFHDETLTLVKSRFSKILDLIIEKSLHKKVKFIGQTRADTIDYELFKKMKEAGFYRLAMGVESGNPMILKRIKKRLDLSKVEESFRLAQKVGMRTRANFIFGHPYETPETARDTINFAVKLNADDNSFAAMTPYPNTEILEMASKGEGGYKLISKNWNYYDKYLGSSLELKSLSKRALERLQMQAHLEVFIRNGRIKDLILYAYRNRRGIFYFSLRFFKNIFKTGYPKKQTAVPFDYIAK